MRRLSAALAALAIAAFGGAAQATVVPLDHVVRLPLAGGAAEVVVGSPKYLDVTVVNSRTVLVHGKELGVTNLIIYDRAGRTVFNERISVVAPMGEEVSVYRGAEATQFVCDSSCRTTKVEQRSPWMEIFGAAAAEAMKPRASQPATTPTTTTTSQ